MIEVQLIQLESLLLLDGILKDTVPNVAWLILAKITCGVLKFLKNQIVVNINIMYNIN